jgi:hypothetical protein
MAAHNITMSAPDPPEGAGPPPAAAWELCAAVAMLAESVVAPVSVVTG